MVHNDLVAKSRFRVPSCLLTCLLLCLGATAQTDDLLLTTGGVKRQCDYGGVPKRIWESIRNFDIPDKPQQWQFRYDPLFLPEIGSDGKLAIKKVNFGTRRRLTLNVFLDNEKARECAYTSLKSGFPAYAGQIAKDNISAIVISQLTISIPDIEQPNVRLINNVYPSTSARESFLVVIETSNDALANEVTELLNSNTTAIFYDMSFAARQATYNSVKVKFSDLKKTDLFVKLNGMNTTTVLVHRDDMRRLLEKSSSVFSFEGIIENAEQFDRDLLRTTLDRLGTKQAVQLASFDENKIKSTYNGKDLEPTVLTKSLNKVFQWDEGSNTFKVNTGGEAGGGFNLLGLLEANGNLKGNYSKEEIVTFLRKLDIETQIEGNIIVPKAINLQQINLSDFDSESVFSSVTAYVSKLQEVQKGRVDLNVASKQTQIDLPGRVNELERNQMPIGSVVPFFLSTDEIKALAPKWLPADGRTVSDALSPLNGRKLPTIVDRTILGSSAATDTVEENAATLSGTLDFSARGETEKADASDPIVVATVGTTGTPPGDFLVNDTQVTETRSVKHNHSIPSLNVSVKGKMDFQPFRRLVYLVLVRR